MNPEINKQALTIMQTCKDNQGVGQEWGFHDIQVHQEKMLDVLGV